MSDGSLRITLEFEPRHAKDAYALFGARGTPVAVAALKEGYAAAKDEAPKGGPLAKEAAILCAREDFQTWVCAETEQAAAQSVREMAGVMSRKEFDVDPAAGDRFIQCVRVPWLRHVKQIAAVRPQHQ